MLNKNKFKSLILVVTLTLSTFLGGCSNTNDINKSDDKTKETTKIEGIKLETLKQDKSKSITKDEENKNKLSEFNLVEAKVKRVVDGDTIELEDGKKVRLIGVNTPESTNKNEPYGKEASNYTKSELEGKTIYLEKDVSETDKYGRLLRYIWTDIPKDKSETEIRAKMFNALLVLNGFSQQSTYPPDVKYQNYFGKYAAEARKNNKGLWAIDPNGTTKGDNNKVAKSNSNNKTNIANSNKKINSPTKKTNVPKNIDKSKNKSQSSTTSKQYKKVQESNNSSVFYVTPKGKKYHKPGCRTIKGDYKKATLQEVKNNNYQPCKVCHP